MPTKPIHDWVEKSPFGAGLGVRLEAVSDTGARIVLPFREANSNPGDALHGGCAASLGVIGGHAVARTALGDGFTTFHTASCQVSYLAAAIGEEVTAITTLLRRGKEMCFTETTVATAKGKPISHITTLVRGRSASEPAIGTKTIGDDGASEPGEMGPFIGMMPFTAARQLCVEHMADSRARIVMPLGDANGDLGGGFHEGAALALLDTTGAMASWAETGPGRYKASTAAMQAQVVGSLTADNLVGYGRVVQRDNDLFWADVEVADSETRHVHVRGTVIYRDRHPMSDTPIEAELSKISNRVRYWREERGLSRQELAGLSGVAASTVHKVETHQMTPSIAVLLKLAHGLGRRPAEILAEGTPEVTVSIQRSGDRQTTVTPSGRYERLTAELIAGEIEVWRVTIQPAVTSGSPIRFDGEMFIACELGELMIEIGGQRHVLTKGDVAHFKATHPFTYQNDSDTPAQFTLAATLPTELRSVVEAHATAAANR